MEPSFVASVGDRMIKVSDAASFASTLWLEKETGRKFGPSTGLNFYTGLVLAHEMKSQNIAGSVVTLICDLGNRYQYLVFQHVYLQRIPTVLLGRLYSDLTIGRQFILVVLLPI